MGKLSKAIAAAVGAFGGGLGIQFLGAEGIQALEALVNAALIGVVGFATTWIAPRNTE